MKLTKAIVERVVRKVVQHRFSTEVLDIRCAEAKLFNEAWAHVYTDAEQKFLLGAPDGFVCTTATFHLRVGGQRHDLSARGSDYGVFAYALSAEDGAKISLLPYGARCAVAQRDGYVGDKLYFAAGDEGLPAAVVALAARKAELVKLIEQAERKVEAALTGTTRTKAVQLWPEIEPFLPVEVKSAGLPALPTKELNALLDLPVDEAA